MSSSVSLCGILSKDIEEVWESVEGLLIRACKTNNGRMSPELLKGWLQDGEMQLWIAKQGEGIAAACVTEILVYKTGIKYCRIHILTGKGFKSWWAYEKQISEWAKSQGCYGMEALARKGWARIFKDYKVSHWFLEKVL